MSDERNPEEIRAQIEATRNELGDTVAALAVKTDVKKQVVAKRDALLGRARETRPGAVEASSSALERVKANPLPAAIAGAALVGLALGRLTSRR